MIRFAIASVTVAFWLGCKTSAPSPSSQEPGPVATEGPAPADEGWPAHLSPLAVLGSTFELVADDDSKIVVVGTVVQADPSAIQIVWTENGAPSTGSMPTTISRRGDVIVIDDVEFNGPGDADEGNNAQAIGNLMCYENGPAADAPDCESVCFSAVCFHETLGLVQVSGNWGRDQDYVTSPRCSQTTGELRCD